MMEIKSGLRVLSILMLIIGCISCEDSLIDSKALLIAYTDKNEYKINEEITYAIVNFSSSTAYIKFYGPYVINRIDKKSIEGWEIYFTPAIPAIYGPVSRNLEPGKNIEWVIPIILEEGKYRIVIPAGMESNVRLDDKVYTNEFIVKE